MILSSTKADTFVLAELTVPWEDRIGQSKTLKEDRYMELTMDLQQKGYKSGSPPLRSEQEVWSANPPTHSFEKLVLLAKSD